jgi:hypothetical protein
MSTPQERRGGRGECRTRDRSGTDYDLQFVRVYDGETPAGGWYRELPGDEIEVLSRAQLERVPLDHSDPEDKAREKIAEILKRS